MKKTRNNGSSNDGSLKIRLKSILKNVFLTIIVYMIFNTIRFQSKQPKVEVLTPDHVDSYTSLSDYELAQRLGKAVQFKTISYADFNENQLNSNEEILNFHKYLGKIFPLVHKHLELKVVNTHSLLYHWKGTEDERVVKPILLMAHQDVVPVDKIELWEYDPFEGKVDDTHIWGRGTMDDKQMVMGLLEVVEDLLRQHYKPTRSYYFSFGHDEEIGGDNGAKHAAEYLASKGVQFEFILDEGLPIMNPPVFPGLSKSVATVGICEKGAMNLELSVNVTGGHSSMPPRETAIGILSAALARIEANPVPPQTVHSSRLIDFLGRETTLPYRFVFSNLWLFEPLIIKIFSAKPTLDALQRTTTAITMVNGGTKPNVLPMSASAIINFRVAPGDSIGSVIHHIQRVANDDRVQIKLKPLSVDPSPVSSTDSAAFKLLQSTILQEFPDTIVSPSLMIANTDTRWFWPLTQNIFRFCPLVLENSDLPRFHGVNERVSIKNYKQIIDFYYHLIKNSDKINI